MPVAQTAATQFFTKSLRLIMAGDTPFREKSAELDEREAFVQIADKPFDSSPLEILYSDSAPDLHVGAVSLLVDRHEWSHRDLSAANRACYPVSARIIQRFCTKKRLGIKGWLRFGDRHQDQWPLDKGNGFGVICVNCFETQWHWKFNLNAIAIVP
jgi:hypothetical protein